MRTAYYISIFFCAFLFAEAQTTYPKQIADKISLAEQNLYAGASVIVEGSPKYSIIDRMKAHNVNGVSIAVINNYKIEWAKAYGLADTIERRKVTTETLFQAGSLSKSINAAAVLKLAEEKKIDLNADINNYLVSWKFPYDSITGGKTISITNLLCHTAGVNRGGLPYYTTDSIPTLLQLLKGENPARTPPVRSEIPPGLKYQYSNNGIAITQLMIEDLTKQTYKEFVSEKIFGPLGMTNSFYWQPPPSDHKEELASAYQKWTTGEKYFVIPELAAGGLWSTPTDLAKFIIEVQVAQKGKSNKIISKEMASFMLSPKDDKEAGVGVFIKKTEGQNFFGHSGSTPGFRAHYRGSLNGGYGIVIMVNSDDDVLIHEIVNSVAGVYNWHDLYIKPLVKKSKSISDTLLSQYEGVYRNGEEVYLIYRRSNELWYRNQEVKWKIHFSSDTDFFNIESLSTKIFYRDGKGKVCGFYKRYNGETDKIEKIESIDSAKINRGICRIYGFDALEDRNYPIAIAFLKRGVDLYDGDLNMMCGLAYAYLFSGQYESAMNAFRRCAGQTFPTGGLVDNAILEDFVYFKSKGYDVSMLKKVLRELNIDSKGEL